MPRKKRKTTTTTTTSSNDNDSDETAPLEATNIMCPITLMIMDDPVVLSDGFTYERQAIERWLEHNSKSPMTNIPLRNKNLTDNRHLKSLISSWKQKKEKEKMEKARPKKRVRTRRGKKKMETNNEQAEESIEIKNVQSLGKIFEKIDPLRDVLSVELDGWSPPKFIVLGAEDSGKSTLLDRITMLPMFPQGRNICTRLPIEVQLRRATPPATC